MNIVFSPDTFLLQSYGGISRYFVRIAEAMAGAGHNIRIPAPYHFNNYLNASPLGQTKIKIDRETKMTRRILRLVNGADLQFQALKNNPDILHFTFFRRFPPVITKSARVVTVFDMIDELFHAHTEAGRKLAKFKKRAVDEADIVLCISENTRRDLINLFKVPPSKTIVTYLAADPPPESVAQDRHPLNGHPYILYVGQRSGYKNFKSAVEAYARLHQRHKNLKFVAFGSGPFLKDDIDLFRSVGLANDDIVQKAGSDLQLYNFYRHATAFIYPSLYEGFGIPPLEAMSVGCPVICSNTSSIPEIVGEAAFQFDPNHSGSIDDAIRKAIEDSTARTEMIGRGYTQFQKFSWDKCAADTLNAYEQIVGARN